jgi:hypothetical protein
LGLAVYGAVSPNKCYEILIRARIGELDMRDLVAEVSIFAEQIRSFNPTAHSGDALLPAHI